MDDERSKERRHWMLLFSNVIAQWAQWLGRHSLQLPFLIQRLQPTLHHNPAFHMYLDLQMNCICHIFTTFRCVVYPIILAVDVVTDKIPAFHDKKDKIIRILAILFIALYRKCMIC